MRSARASSCFPNVALSVLPNHDFVMVMHPPGRAAPRGDVPAHEPGVGGRPETEEAIDESMRFWDEVNLEDIEIVERVQRGLANTSYTGGRMCYRFEESIHRFQNLVIDRMLGIERIPEGDAVEQAPMFARER